MTRAAFTAAQLGSDPDVARPYAFREGRLERLEAKSDRTLHAAGGMGASIDDLARWLRAQLGDGSIDGRRALPAVAVRGMRAMAVATTERHPLRPDLVRVGWSAGWEVRTEGGDTIYVHTGSYAGAAAHMSYCPARGIGVAVLANADAPPLTELLAIEAYDHAAGRSSPDVSTRLAQVMTRFLPSASADSLPRRPGDAPSGYSGRFRDPHWGDVVTAVRGDEVTMRLGELAVPLRWRGPDTFVADGDTPGRFERDRTGRVVAVWLTLAPGDSARFARR